MLYYLYSTTLQAWVRDEDNKRKVFTDKDHAKQYLKLWGLDPKQFKLIGEAQSG